MKLKQQCSLQTKSQTSLCSQGGGISSQNNKEFKMNIHFALVPKKNQKTLKRATLYMQFQTKFSAAQQAFFLLKTAAQQTISRN